MDKKQENQLTMFYAVQKTLERHGAVWSGTPAMVAASTEYDANIASLEACVEKQVIDIRGFARAKAEAEAEMVAMTLQVAGGVRAYATVVGDSVLADKMNVTRSTLLRHRDSVVAQHCQGIHTEATAVVASLADYGVLPATLTALQGAIDAYVAAITAPRNAITQRKGATAELRMLIKDTTKLLVKRLDSLVEQYRLANAEFYREYHNSRMIVDLGTGSGEGTGTPVPVAA
ncbi:MAG: hypothetical protein IPM49_09240 [Flavobacteriales bacterium]|nr:hypothetical protein [Flavobacteriales bacterium]